MGKLYRLRPYHKRAIRKLLAKGVISGILSCPRGWGKTGLIAALLVWALFDREGAQVLAVSTAKRTARLSYDRAVRIIELNPRLSAQCLVFHNAADPYTWQPHRNSFMYPLPADESSTVGMDPTFVIIDEVGYVPMSVYTTMLSSMGKSEETLAIAIGTPGLGTVEKDGSPNIMWQLREMARSENPPPGLAYVEYSADLEADVNDRKQWKKANPGIGDLIDWESVALDAATLPPSVFRQMRLGMWTTRERQWVSPELWDALPIIPGVPDDGATIVLGFDGSVSGDGTALMGYELSTSRLFVVGWWQRPANGGWDWKVPRSEVIGRVEQAFNTWNVVFMYMDPPYWREEMEKWQEELGAERVIEYPTFARARMAVATDRLYTAIKKVEVAWDGTPELRGHVMSAVAERTPMGDVVRKDARHPMLIDLAVASILAYEAGAAAENAPVPAIY
jgi:hypothetical protein